MDDEKNIEEIEQINGCTNSTTKANQYAKMRVRPRMVKGVTEKQKIGCGTLYIHVNYDDDGLIEVFSNLGKGGGCPAQSEATARLISLCLRCNVDPEAIVRQLTGIRCPSACIQRLKDKSIESLSCPDAIARAIRNALNNLHRL